MPKSNLKEYVANTYVAKVKFENQISVFFPKPDRQSGWFACKVVLGSPLRIDILLSLDVIAAAVPQQIRVRGLRWLKGVPVRLRSA